VHSYYCSISDSGGGTYIQGFAAAIEALPSPGFAFDKWQGDLTSTLDTEILIMDGDKSVTAVFVPLFTLTTDVTPESSGTILESGDGSYIDSSLATLEAVPLAGYIFSHWEGAYVGADNLVEVTMDSNKEVTAVFLRVYNLALSVSPEGSGTIDDSGDGIYVEDSTATVEAIPGLGYLFDHWEGNASGEEVTKELLMNADKNLTAYFVKDLSDEDGDGLTAYEELAIYGTNPRSDDSDGDGINDQDEIGTIFDPAYDDTATMQFLTENPELYLDLVSSLDAIYPAILVTSTKSGDFIVKVRIEATSNLNDWETLDLTEAVIEGDTMTLVIPASESAEFLRILGSKKSP